MQASSLSSNWFLCHGKTLNASLSVWVPLTLVVSWNKAGYIHMTESTHSSPQLCNEIEAKKSYLDPAWQEHRKDEIKLSKDLLWKSSAFTFCLSFYFTFVREKHFINYTHNARLLWIAMEHMLIRYSGGFRKMNILIAGFNNAEDFFEI